MTVVRFTTGESCDVIDADCEFRPCFVLGFDKGTFAPGRGYTSYHAVERRVCWTRHMQGCPHIGMHLVCGGCRAVLGLFMEGEKREKPDTCPTCDSDDLYWLADVLPLPKPCCADMRVAKPRPGLPPFRQRCRSCGTWLRGKRLDAARAAS